MRKLPLLLDCDPGVDDAIAILLSKHLTSLELIAVTSVAGNVGVEHTTRNALDLLALAGMDQIPVYRGAAKPMFGEAHTAPHVHGQNGLGGLVLPPSRRQPEELPAWDAIDQTARRFEGELTVVAIGPLTNLGLALVKYKDLPKRIKRVVLMGGAAVGGNVTPAAEFNAYADPEAADIVFNSGLNVVMCGLDVTVPAYLTTDELDELGAQGSKQAGFARDVAQGSKQAGFARDVAQGLLAYSKGYGLPGMCMHDPLALLYADDETLLKTERAGVRVETKGKLTRGKTVTDLYSDKKIEKNAWVATGVDRETFKRRLFETMAHYGSE
ncbi:MAG: nucleoside hydrolase [Clostridiaceae bacterium]